MANEISYRGDTTGGTMRATIRNATRQMWSTAGTPAFEALTVANWANYILTLTETPGSSYFYVGDWPATLTTVGWYTVDVYSGTAISSPLVASFTGYWNGTSFLLRVADVEEMQIAMGYAYPLYCYGDGDLDPTGSHAYVAGRYRFAGVTDGYPVFSNINNMLLTLHYHSETGRWSISHNSIGSSLTGTTRDLFSSALSTADGATGNCTFLQVPATSPLGETLALDATVSKPGTAQTITPPANMALAGEAATALTANPTLAKLDSIVEVVP